MRTFGVILWQEQDGLIKACHLEVYEDEEQREKKQGRFLLGNLSKRELDNLFWLLEDARKDMVYENSPSPPQDTHSKNERKE